MMKGFGDELDLYKQDNPLRHAIFGFTIMTTIAVISKIEII